MAIYRRFTFCMQSTNLLRIRNCSLNLYQSASKNTLKSIKESIFPLKPKRPLSPFLLFIKEARIKFLKQDPSLKQTEIVKKASKEWAELDPSEKESFQQIYDKNYELYAQQLKQYNNSITDEQKQLWEEKKQQFSKKLKDLNIKQKSDTFGKPKKPPSAFLSYLIEMKTEKDPTVPFTDWLKSVTKNWNQMSEAEKKPYTDKVTELMVQYRKDLNEWEMKMINLGHTDIVRQITLTKQKRVTSEQ
ncbi:transcription factor A, mitochondrial-like [Ceratina calcarata]|uniref:Transcription factor A, mitochondrial-like n=1 Tax=Ceratina calcarata TaxID=156304 RepID=A0AAJ7NBN9_9HYME|nr:transcription factor A, mitochondrial-like [Ceratina calcarata]XP_017887282.1 transcription factor A, mitochondrial-like [Ceratina calcarata]